MVSQVLVNSKDICTRVIKVPKDKFFEETKGLSTKRQWTAFSKECLKRRMPLWQTQPKNRAPIVLLTPLINDSVCFQHNFHAIVCSYDGISNSWSTNRLVHPKGTNYLSKISNQIVQFYHIQKHIICRYLIQRVDTESERWWRAGTLHACRIECTKEFF